MAKKKVSKTEKCLLPLNSSQIERARKSLVPCNERERSGIKGSVQITQGRRGGLDYEDYRQNKHEALLKGTEYSIWGEKKNDDRSSRKMSDEVEQIIDARLEFEVDFNKMLGNLSDELRDILECLWAGKDYKEIAMELKISSKTISKRVKSLRNVLEQILDLDNKYPWLCQGTTAFKWEKPWRQNGVVENVNPDDIEWSHGILSENKETWRRLENAFKNHRVVGSL